MDARQAAPRWGQAFSLPPAFSRRLEFLHFGTDFLTVPPRVDQAEAHALYQVIEETWPSVTFGEGNLGSTTYHGAVGTVKLTDRYFRALAKIGFHYFLTQFPQYTGQEPIFCDLRRFIVEDVGNISRVNEFIGNREHPLLGEMLAPSVRPAGWRAHVLCAETRPGECLAYVQMFVSEDWPAPVYAVRLAREAAIIDCRATGHAYIYYVDGPRGTFSGDAFRLETTRADWPAPPLAPVIVSA